MKKKITRGSVFQRVYRNRSGELKRTKRWYVKYYANGKPIMLPTETEDHDEALDVPTEADGRRGRAENFRPPGACDHGPALRSVARLVQAPGTAHHLRSRMFDAAGRQRA